jgi:2-keto-4-pentenoate hydratase
VRPVNDIDPAVVAALHAQLAPWRAALRGGAERVGWKIGLGIHDVEGQIGADVPVIGHLTTATQLGSGARYRAGAARDLKADTELTLKLGRTVEADADAASARAAIAGLAVAIELVDIARPPYDLEPIVAANVFHRAFALGPVQSEVTRGPFEARTWVNDSLRAVEHSDEDLATAVLAVARLLGSVGERLEPEDHIITGSITQVALEPGDEVAAAIGNLGKVTVSVGA